MEREAGENPAQGRCCIRQEVRALCHCDVRRGKAAWTSLPAVSQKTCLSREHRGASDLGRRAGRNCPSFARADWRKAPARVCRLGSPPLARTRQKGPFERHVEPFYGVGNKS